MRKGGNKLTSRSGRAKDNQSSRTEIEHFLSSCRRRGLRITAQRRLVIEVLLDSHDHPDVATLHARVRKRNPAISAATVYRTLNLLEEGGVILRHDFQGSASARYEPMGAHHDHLIDVENGAVIEFYNGELEDLQEKIAARLGYRLVNHHMTLYGVPRSKSSPSKKSEKENKQTKHNKQTKRK